MTNKALFVIHAIYIFNFAYISFFQDVTFISKIYQHKSNFPICFGGSFKIFIFHITIKYHTTYCSFLLNYKFYKPVIVSHSLIRIPNYQCYLKLFCVTLNDVEKRLFLNLQARGHMLIDRFSKCFVGSGTDHLGIFSQLWSVNNYYIPKSK